MTESDPLGLGGDGYPEPEPAAPTQAPSDEPEAAVHERVHLARNTAVMAAGTLLSRLTGLGKLAALTAAFGVVEGRLADAYNLANVAPNLTYELVLGGVLTSVLVPIFVETRARDRAEHRHVVNTLTTLAGAVLVSISLLAIFFAGPLAVLLTLRADGDPADVEALRQLVTTFLRLFMPQVAFYGLTTIWTAYLNAHRHFAAPMFSPVLNNLAVIGAVLWFAAMVGFEAVDIAALTTGQVLLLGLGTTAGIVAMTVPLWPVARRHEWSWKPSFDWRHPMVARVARLGGWTIVYVVINVAGYLVVVALANQIVGGYAAYFYAFTFFQLPHGIYAVSVMTALVPTMSAAAAAGDLDRFREQLARGIRVTALVMVPAGVGLTLLATPVVRLLEQGVFSPESTALVARVLAAFALGLPSFSIFLLFVRAHYALQDTRTPALVNLAAVGANTVVNLILFLGLPDPWKVPGLAIGHACAYTVGMTIFAGRLRRRLGGLEGGTTAGALARIGGSAAVMGAVAWATARWLGALFAELGFLGQLATVGGAVSVGAVLYLALARLLGVGELTMLTGLVARRFARRS